MYATKEESQSQKEISKSIANEILRQMRIMDKNLMMCMGFRKPLIIPNGLQFTVSGLLFKGNVQVTLNGSDLYDIKLVKNRRKLNKELTELSGSKFYDSYTEVKNEINNVFFDQLMPILEKNIERR